MIGTICVSPRFELTGRDGNVGAVSSGGGGSCGRRCPGAEWRAFLARAFFRFILVSSYPWASPYSVCTSVSKIQHTDNGTPVMLTFSTLLRLSKPRPCSCLLAGARARAGLWGIAIFCVRPLIQVTIANVTISTSVARMTYLSSHLLTPAKHSLSSRATGWHYSEVSRSAFTQL